MTHSCAFAIEWKGLFFVIELTKLNNKKFILNSELIETIESTPDTVITLRNGKLLIVSEPPEMIAQMVLDYRRSQYSQLLAGVLRDFPPNYERPPGQPDESGR